MSKAKPTSNETLTEVKEILGCPADRDIVEYAKKIRIVLDKFLTGFQKGVSGEADKKKIILPGEVVDERKNNSKQGIEISQRPGQIGLL